MTGDTIRYAYAPITNDLPEFAVNVERINERPVISDSQSLHGVDVGKIPEQPIIGDEQIVGVVERDVTGDNSGRRGKRSHAISGM